MTRTLANSITLKEKSQMKMNKSGTGIIAKTLTKRKIITKPPVTVTYFLITNLYHPISNKYRYRH
jgi:hypothetical protein